jgi:hypothetical protein
MQEALKILDRRRLWKIQAIVRTMFNYYIGVSGAPNFDGLSEASRDA